MKTGARRHASLGNGSEPASSELRVAEIGGYAIQFYQNNHSGIIWDFCIQPNGGVQLNFCMGYPFIFNGGLQIFITSLSTANYLIFQR